MSISVPFKRIYVANVDGWIFLFYIPRILIFSNPFIYDQKFNNHIYHFCVK